MERQLGQVIHYRSRSSSMRSISRGLTKLAVEVKKVTMKQVVAAKKKNLSRRSAVI